MDKPLFSELFAPISPSAMDHIDPKHSGSARGQFLLDVGYGRFRHCADLIVCDCTYALNQYHDDLFPALGVAFPSQLNDSVVERRADYLAGRYCAMRALQSLGIPSPSIGINNDRSPVWPAGIVGSISHADCYAIAVAAFVGHVDTVGVDVESVLRAGDAADVIKIVLPSEDIQVLSAQCNHLAQLVTIAFSAKESAYKALYPQVKRFFDFSAVYLQSIDLNSHIVNMKLAYNLSDKWRSGDEINGHFSLENERIISLVLI